MKAELAKELRDAGFPQRLGSLEASIHSAFGVEWAYHPDLSELIEACGEDFRNVTRHSSGKWTAKGGLSALGHWTLTNGSTPEIAVARVWLALNKK